jgi:hypothetical protein
MQPQPQPTDADKKRPLEDGEVPPAKRPRTEGSPSVKRVVADVIDLDPARGAHVSPLYGDISEADGNGLYIPFTTKKNGVFRRKVLIEFPTRTGIVSVVVETTHTAYRK